MDDLSEADKRAAKLSVAIRELTIQNEAKGRQAAELLIANGQLQKAEEKISKANRLYAFVSQINQKIVRVKDEAALFSNACNIALEFGGFKMAWVGMLSGTPGKTTVTEHCGVPEEEIKLAAGAPWHSKAPQDRVLRSGTHYICNNVETDPEIKNWRPFAARYGIHSYIVLPIKRLGIIIGTLNLYSTELDFAGNDEIKLLVDIGGDISFALDLFEREKQHNMAAAEIKASEMLYHSLFDNMLEGFAHCKMIYENNVPVDFIYLNINHAFESLTGLKDITGKKATEQIPGLRTDNPELFETYSRVALTGEPERFEAYLHALKMWLDISVYSTKKEYFTAVFEVVTEKKEANEKLTNSEKHFRALIEHGADMKSLSDKEGRVLYGSPSIQKGLAYTATEFSLKYPYHLIHPDDLEGYMPRRRQLLLTPGQFFSFLQRRLHKNGNWIWCEGTLTNLLDEPGAHALVTNFRDVSGRIKAEEEALFNKNNLSALINNTNDLMWSVDRDFNLITANQAFNKIMTTAFGQKIAPGSSMFDLPYPQEVLDRFKQLYEKAFTGESFIEIEHFDVPIESWLEVSYSPIRKGDEVIGTACHSRDITDSMQAEKKLSQSEARLNEAQGIAHISNWEVDLITGMNIWSNEFYKIFEIEPGTIEPSPEAFLSLLHPDDLNYAMGMVERSFNTHEDSNFDCRTKLGNERIKHLHTESKFEFDKNKNPIRLYGILQDVTEQKEAQLKIKDLNDHLEKRVEERTNELLETNKALEAFSYSVPHDLRSPVRSVMGFAKLIQKEHGTGMNASEKELFGHIEDSGRRMNAIIDDLLSFAKWGKEELVLAEVDMTALFAHVWKNTMRESPHHAILELQPLPKVQADMAMIRQVVVNLISNAVKYSSKKEKPVVKVGYEQTATEVIFHVSDNGAGFDMAHYNRLFGAFQRLHGMSEFEGTGIGLTLIKTIIEKHKGRVWAEGKPGEGATFYFSLPVV